MTKKRPSTTRGEGTPKKTAGKKVGCGCLLLIALAILLFGGCSALMGSGSDDTQPSSAPSASLTQEPTADPSGDLLSTFVATPEGAPHTGAITSITKRENPVEGNPSTFVVQTNLQKPQDVEMAMSICQALQTSLATSEDQINVNDVMNNFLVTTMEPGETCTPEQ